MSKIDYDLTKIRAFVFDVDGVLSPSTITMNAHGEPVRMANVKDGFALALAVKQCYEIAIVTGSYSPTIEARFKSLGIKDIFTKTNSKLPVLTKWMQENGLQRNEVVYVGDDVPDLQCMRAVGLSVAPSDASDDILAIARYISPIAGGYGVARDVIEQVLKVQGKWIFEEETLAW